MKKIVIILLVVIIVIISLLIFINKNKINIGNNTKEAISDFEIIFNESKNSGKKQIISKNTFSEDSYNIYSYDGDVKIKINGIEYDFSEALLHNKITINDILYKAENDANNNLVEIDMFDDGGTVIYKYKTYSIIKFNMLSGNKDIYIGATYMNYSVGK